MLLHDLATPPVRLRLKGRIDDLTEALALKAAFVSADLFGLAAGIHRSARAIRAPARYDPPAELRPPAPRSSLAYFDGLLCQAEEEAQAAWPGKLPCPHCGAPSAVVKAQQRKQGHAIVHAHPNGVRCEGPQRGD